MGRALTEQNLPQKQEQRVGIAPLRAGREAEPPSLPQIKQLQWNCQRLGQCAFLQGTAISAGAQGGTGPRQQRHSEDQRSMEMPVSEPPGLSQCPQGMRSSYNPCWSLSPPWGSIHPPDLQPLIPAASGILFAPHHGKPEVSIFTPTPIIFTPPSNYWSE